MNGRLILKFTGSVVLMAGLCLQNCSREITPKTIEPGWKSVTGFGGPSPAKFNKIISNESKLSLNAQIDGFKCEIQKEKEGVFQKLSIPDAGFMEDIGKPNVPVIRRLIAVPEGKTIEAELVDTAFTFLTGYDIYPAQKPVIEQDSLLRTPFIIDRAAYQSNQFYPDKYISVSKPMRYGRQTVVQIEIYPIQYNPKTKTLKMMTSFKISADFSEDKSYKKRSDVRVLENKLQVTPAYFKEYKKFVNFDWLKDRLALLRGANYLIICADSFASEIEPLKNWKISKGLSVKIVKISAIGQSDTAIHNYISNAYHNWATPPDYVLLVGDVESIPTHTYSNNGSSCATDLYYAAVDGDDFLPDLALGRFSAKADSEVVCMVNKTIGYEKEPATTETDWYSRASLVSDEGYFETTSNWIYDFLTESGYKADKFYKSLGTAKTDTIAYAANQGRFILQYRGHGSVTGWATGPFSNNNVIALHNGKMLPAVISPTCQTGWFDNANSDCFGETWLKKGKSAGENGAVAFWGASRNSYGGYNDELAKGVYKAAFNDGINAFGDITNAAKLYMYNVYGAANSTALLELNLFNVLGDPELNLWFQIPTELNAGWNVIDLDIFGGNFTGGVAKSVIKDVGNQDAFPVLTFTNTSKCFTTFSVPEDWDGISDFYVEFIWYAPTQDGNIKWSMVYDRKIAANTPFSGFNRQVKSFWGARKQRVSTSTLEMWSLAHHGPIVAGDVMTIGLERFGFNANEAGVENAISEAVNLIAARILYKKK
jgi:hypothetical protein